ncbi:response regulator [Paenibacillus roseipurpureus]|uniref:Response regulator n=1 Tax=Paenibacillus roseopurpureus TaxID=2918901 RepID=A0AA96LQN1_9BACL|nr:response regulator [Paenibacillus sp. MBLB1832]WNR45541.1 response regulator [Paenibacillus sp. MBLB1832]
MMKLVVIDDIRSVLDVVAKKIDWRAHGIEVVGTALDGEEGLQLIEAFRPELVLTDIRMPKQDGLELTRQVLAHSPGSKVIIMSAYTDFSYAQQAIRLGAFDFIKKPFAIEEVLAGVLKAKQAWLDQNQALLQQKEMEVKLKESLPILQQEYMALLIHYRTDESNAMQRWKFLEIDLEPKRLTVLVVEIDHFVDKYQAMPAQEIELVRFALQNIMEETILFYTRGFIFRESLNRFVCILQDEEGLNVTGLAEACCVNIETYTRFTISVGISCTAASVMDLPEAYQQAMRALTFHFYTGGNGAFHYSTLAESAKGGNRYASGKDEDFVFAFRSGNKQKTLELLEEMLQALLAHDPLPEPEYAASVCKELCSKLIRILLEKLNYERIGGLDAQVKALSKEDRNSLSEYRQLLKDIIEQGCRMIMEERTDESKAIIYRSMLYIKEHLSEELSLEHCAKQVNLSWGYFSNLFKKVAGVTFQQFVLTERMERAKVMMLENYQIQEIAAELGYEHRRYFSEVFKKYTGMTPSEFKDSYKPSSNL